MRRLCVVYASVYRRMLSAVRFRVEQRFATDPDTLCSALTNLDYLVNGVGSLPDLGAPTLLSEKRDAESVQLRLQYSFHGSLPAVALRVISPERLAWIDDSTVDLVGRRATFSMIPVHYQSFFWCRGTWMLTDATNGGDDSQTLRVIEGELKVNSPVPFVGGQVERVIVSGLKERLAHEPAAFLDWMTGTKPSKPS
jgi:Protein of unknown function (DUF2505)